MSIMIKNYVLMFAMVLAMVFAIVMKPTDKIVDHKEKIDLESMIPKEFGEWRNVEGISQIVLSPERQQLIKNLYDQTLSRTYINKSGKRIMLSIAYGGNQNDSLQIHKPEVCYTAQGFAVNEIASSNFNYDHSSIPVKRLLAIKGSRVEPIIYWVTIGNKATVSGSFRWKLEQIKYGLVGQIPDGLLFRVSSIGEEQYEFNLQLSFIKELILNMSEKNRYFLMGKT